jgi:hypothetical protein
MADGRVRDARYGFPNCEGGIAVTDDRSGDLARL